MKTLSDSQKDTLKYGKKLANKIKSRGVVLLYGDLGTGKTVLTKGIAEELRIEDFKIKSPTYTYIRKYDLDNDIKFYHLDLYRFEEIDELMLLEIQEILEKENVIMVIEWAEKIGGFEIKEATKVKIEYIDENKRSISIKE